MTEILLDAKKLSEIAVKGLQEIKGRNIVRMDLRNSDGSVTDFFVICTGTSDKHVEALADSVVKEMSDLGEKPISKEGFEHAEWILLDYVNVVVHIFLGDKREFYRLEGLWGDAEIERFSEEF
ncbi:MAG: ribosome silencing factor [Bacteroidota bacterium]